jgi:rod shape-determining protein MreD
MLSIAPLPQEFLPINPAWCLLTLLFWTYGNPRRVNVGVAWCVGIIVDGLTGSLLGLHALSFVVVVAILDLFYRRFHMFHLLQQSLMIGVFVICNFIIMFTIRHLLTDNTTEWSLMLSAISSALCWPLYQFFGQKFRLMKG